MTHPLLSSLPAFAAWEAEGQKLAARDERLRAQSDELATQHEAAESKWREAATKATGAGKPVPDKPVPPDARAIDWARAQVHSEEQRHGARRSSVLAECAEEGLAALAAREEARQRRLEELSPILSDLVAEAREDAHLSRDLVRAQDHVIGLRVRPSRADRIDVWPELGRMLDAAAARRSLLDPIPLPLREPRIMTESDAHDNPESAFGYVDRDRPPSTPHTRWMIERRGG